MLCTDPGHDQKVGMLCTNPGHDQKVGMLCTNPGHSSRIAVSYSTYLGCKGLAIDGISQLL
jgi:hypothetical protein